MAGSRMRRSVPGRTHNKIKRQIYEDILAGIVLVLQLFQEFWKGLQQSEKVVTTPSYEVEGAPEINSHGQVLQQSEEVVTISAPACEVESGPEISVHERLQQSEEQSGEVVSTSYLVVEGSAEISSHGFGHSYSDSESNMEYLALSQALSCSSRPDANSNESSFTSDLESVPVVSSNTNDFMNSLPQLPINPEKHEKLE